MRAPAPSLSPIIGAPTDSARSMTLWIFSANTSPSAPPKTVKSWLKTNTLRPSTVPQPVTTPSVSGRLSSMPKPCARWRASMSSSTNEPGSSSRSMRSRAVSLPRSCWRSTAASLPACSACSRSSASCSSRSSIGCGTGRGLGGSSPCGASASDLGLQRFFLGSSHMRRGYRAAPRDGPAGRDGAGRRRRRCGQHGRVGGAGRRVRLGGTDVDLDLAGACACSATGIGDGSGHRPS